jgi:hypothetical protein
LRIGPRLSPGYNRLSSYLYQSGPFLFYSIQTSKGEGEETHPSSNDYAMVTKINHWLALIKKEIKIKYWFKNLILLTIHLVVW